MHIDHKKLVNNFCKGTFRSVSAPLPTKDDWNLNPQFFVDALWKWNPKGSFFVGTFQKVVRRLQILLASLRKKIRTPYSKTCHP